MVMQSQRLAKLKQKWQRNLKKTFSASSVPNLREKWISTWP
jgi:hypothetical protein